MATKSIADKKAELEKQLAEVKAQEKRQEETKNAVIGRVIQEAMQNDSDLTTRVNALLADGLKKNSERTMFGLEKLATNRGRKSTVSA